MPATATKKHTPNIHSSYLHSCLEPHTLREVITYTVKRLYPLRHEFDSIAFRGASGCLVAPAVATRLRKQLILVRRGEHCHSSFEVEGNVATERYIILDDIVASGRTVGHIIDAIRRRQEALNLAWVQHNFGQPVPVGTPILVACYLDWANYEGRRCFGNHGDYIRIIGCKPTHLQ